MKFYYQADNKSWLELNKSSAEKNLSVIRGFAGSAKVYAVVKSNAYGHGLELFSKLMDNAGVDGFCVGSVPEGALLRGRGIKKPILVLGFSSTEEWKCAKKESITVSVSSLPVLREICSKENSIEFHLEVDTGMRRRGILSEEAEEAVKIIKEGNGKITGVFTHFASAKDMNYPGFTDNQISAFDKVAEVFKNAGLNLVHHASATSGILISDKHRFDMVRVGIGLYGYYPSKELEIQLGDIGLRPIMKWKSRISEIKNAKRGDYVGYDLTERLAEDSVLAVVPVGYWHGLPRDLSGIAEFTVGGVKCKIIGRISMAMTTIRVPIGTRIGDEVIVMDDATTFSRMLGGSYYEVITRINPVIHRILV